MRRKLLPVCSTLLAAFIISSAAMAARAPVDDWINDFTGSQLYPSQLGKPGWPGMVPGKASPGPWGFPERIPYPGSVEHVRIETQRYIPVVPLCNAKTLVKNFTAADLPGVQARVIEYSEPIYSVPKYNGQMPTGQTNRPVKVLKWTKSDPAIELDLGTLKPSMYVLRLIAATPTENVERAAQRLVIDVDVNDSVNGAVSHYRKRCAAIDEFYSIVEFFFYAVEERGYRVKVSIDASTVLPVLYLHNVDLHDKLAQLANRAGKKAPVLYDEKERAEEWKENGGPKPDARTAAQKDADDAKVWATYIPLNTQPFVKLDAQEDLFTRSAFSLVDKAKDDGLGVDLYGPDMLWNRSKESLAANKDWTIPLVMQWAPKLNLTRHTAFVKGYELLGNYNTSFRQAAALTEKYHETGDETAARAAAQYLAQVAVLNMTCGSRQGLAAYDLIPAFVHDDITFRRRAKEMVYEMRGYYGEHTSFVSTYDYLFPYIRGNKDLADALGKRLPWIRNVEDMQRFYDTFILQYYAHQIMAYNVFLDSPTPGWMSNVIAIQQDPKVIAPWVDWLFKYVWTYPNRPAGIDELAVNAVNRDGTNKKGSVFYTLDGSFLSTMMSCFTKFRQDGGALPSDVTDPARFPKAVWGPRFKEQISVAGGYMFYSGDVSGPTRPRLQDLGPALRKTPEKIPNNPSRVLSSWGGILETGREESDFRNRRAVGVRVGSGDGHGHNDPLDLQIWAQGVPMCGDGGGRSGYAVPENGSPRSHNTVVSNLGGGHRWVSTFAPMEGAQYLYAKCSAAYGRQVALIDVEPANSYVVDVFRIRGGDAPAYAFHGMPADQFETNVADRRKGDLGEFLPEDSKWTGTCPATLTATWRMRRDPETVTWTTKDGKKGELKVPGAERMAMGPDFDAKSPRKFVRMHLLGHAGDETYGGRALCLQGSPFTNENLYVRPKDWKNGSSTVFPAVYEPFAGEPFIKSVRLLTPVEGLKNAAATVAIEVTLVSGRRDVILCAPREAPVAMVNDVTFQGEFGFLSYDDKGLRQGALASGVKLAAKGLSIASDKPAYEGTIKSIDYYKRTAEFSAPLPKNVDGAVIETGCPSNVTSYTLTGAEGTKVSFLRGMDLYMSRVAEFTADGLPILQTGIPMPPGITATDDDLKHWWKIPAKGASASGVVLEGGPAPKESLKPGDALRLWEIGPGDPFRLPAQVNVTRGPDGKYVTKASVEAKVQTERK